LQAAACIKMPICSLLYCIHTDKNIYSPKVGNKP